MFDVSINTIKNRIEALINAGDLSVQNFEQIKIPDSNGRTHETTVYDLTVLNKLAMKMMTLKPLKIPRNLEYSSRGTRTLTVEECEIDDKLSKTDKSCI